MLSATACRRGVSGDGSFAIGRMRTQVPCLSETWRASEQDMLVGLTQKVPTPGRQPRTFRLG